MVTDFQLNTLREVTGIGVKTATAALEQMLNRRIDIAVPDIKVVSLAEVPDFLGGAEKEIVGLHLKMLGEFSGSILLKFSVETAHVLVNTLLDEGGSDKTIISELGESALKEIGNIITNTYLNIIAQMLEVNTFPSVPHFARDMLGAIIDFMLIEISCLSDYALVIKTQFEASNLEIEGDFLIFPDEKSLNLLYESLGIK
jgi:chemotaxis protein CheC